MQLSNKSKLVLKRLYPLYYRKKAYGISKKKRTITSFTIISLIIDFSMGHCTDYYTRRITKKKLALDFFLISHLPISSVVHFSRHIWIKKTVSLKILRFFIHIFYPYITFFYNKSQIIWLRLLIEKYMLHILQCLMKNDDLI